MCSHVECVSDIYATLTKGAIYKVEYVGLNYITVKNDMDNLRSYPSDIFRRLTKKGVFENKTKPTYYGVGFDVIDFCQKNNLDFMQGNVIKYVTRYKEKNGKEDLLKAKEYIDRMIKEIK